MGTSRPIVAELAASLYAGRISYDEFISSLPPECERDKEVAELIDLITHEPKPGGLFGISATDQKAYVAEIQTRIESLKKEPIQSPSQRGQPSVIDHSPRT